jgi:effector-binding domain-containing protein
MKFLKAVTYSLLGFITVYLFLCSFFSKYFEVEKSIDINNSAILVFEQINNLKNWEKWDPWLNNEPNMKLQYNNTKSGVGSLKKWESKSYSNGQMEIIESFFINSIKIKTSIQGWSSFNFSFNFYPIKKGVRIKWKSTGELTFLMRVMAPVIKKMIGQDIENGLMNLKTYCQSIANNSGEITFSNWSDSHQYYMIDSCRTTSISSTIEKIYNEILISSSTKDLNKKSTPFIQFVELPKKQDNSNRLVINAGILTDYENKFKSGNIKYVETSSNNTIECIHFGVYSTINETHKKIKNYASENNLNLITPAYELFLNNPSSLDDQSKWMTKVVYEIK